MEKTWDEIRSILDIGPFIGTDAEWDEAKMKAMEYAIEAIIDKLSRAMPDPA
jgi:hypothetical protein